MNRIITIGREFGSGGREMGVRLANDDVAVRALITCLSGSDQ